MDERSVETDGNNEFQECPTKRVRMAGIRWPRRRPRPLELPKTRMGSSTRGTTRIDHTHAIPSGFSTLSRFRARCAWVCYGPRGMLWEPEARIGLTSQLCCVFIRMARVSIHKPGPISVFFSIQFLLLARRCAEIGSNAASQPVFTSNRIWSDWEQTQCLLDTFLIPAQLVASARVTTSASCNCDHTASVYRPGGHKTHQHQ